MADWVWRRHELIEKNSLLMLICALIVVSIGGLIEIVPLFFLNSTIEKVEGMRPYTPLELMGRAIYMREGCYNCHSQMIRSTREEIERYGHYSLAAESMYDHPFQWGSKRTGPDIARVGGKYSDEWHVAHLSEPRSVVAESIMPPYRFLAETPLKFDDIVDHLEVNRMVGVPYTKEMIAQAKDDLVRQTDPDAKGSKEFLARYPKANVRKFVSGSDKITEMDALVAYLQMLGTLVDFSKFEAAGPNLR